ncbi:hypothetical protein HZ326_31791 [Fusarium oxysporum f. sp. albedinis]|nr:hypothetical protein HZ326_31791 [Fusarium oxysporum f. sp. albedinis]
MPPLLTSLLEASSKLFSSPSFLGHLKHASIILYGGRCYPGHTRCHRKWPLPEPGRPEERRASDHSL